MDAAELSPDASLPDDPKALQALVRELLAEVARLRAENAELRGKLDAALRHRFGRRSERRKPPPRSPVDTPARPRAPHGRSPLPDHLERREVVHDLTAAEQLCPGCGQPRVCIGTQTAEQLDLEPARFFVLRTVRRSHSCRHCDPANVPASQRLQTAGPEQVGPIPKGLCGPGLCAHVVTAKFADHIPVHRLCGQLARSGVTIACSTLGGWLAGAACLLTPVYRLMHRRLLLSRVIHGDDTPVKLRVPGADRTRKAHLWVGVGDADYPYVVFDFTAEYTAAGPERFLGGFAGYLQADALAQYEGLYAEDRVKHVCCWAHARRKFVAAAEGGDERANAALDLIRELYAIERDLPSVVQPADGTMAVLERRQREEQRCQVRQRLADPVLESLKAWLDGHRPMPLPKSLLGQAIGYALNNWAALRRYRDQGYLAIDNNLAERTLRAVALGRNNWGVLGSEAGGRMAAVLYSVVGTCRRLGLDPQAYLRDALPGVFALGEGPPAEPLLDWLPDRWEMRRGRDAPARGVMAG